jgi:AcrR family transcriptional regulator
MPRTPKSGADSRPDPQQRILRAAVLLFAQKGYAAVGVREIANQAGVNISMISYYFDGKAGILKSIMEDFFREYLKVFDVADAESKPPDVCAREVVGNLVRFIRNNLELASVGYNELALEMPEIASLKSENVLKMIERAGWLIQRLGLDPADRFRIGIIGPSFFSVVMMHFRIRHIQRKVFGFRLDDAFYEEFTEAVTNLLLYGLLGLTAEQKPHKGNTHV